MELVGKNFNSTPGIENGNKIALHAEQVCEFKASPTATTAKEWLAQLAEFFGPEMLHEGVVVEHKGKWWKIRAEHVLEKVPKKKAFVRPRTLC